MTTATATSKRVMDLVASVCTLILATPVIAVAALLIKWDSPGPIFFRDERIGRGFLPFQIIKLRTMTHSRTDNWSSITLADDPRVTRIGRWLRRYRFDELPQLINIIRGDMSLVGPRPESSRYVQLKHADYASILEVRPGITDPASLKYHNEGDQLSSARNPEQEYIDKILPKKIMLSKHYIANISVFGDLIIIARTLILLLSLFGTKHSLGRNDRS